MVKNINPGKTIAKKAGKGLASKALGAANLVFSVIPDTVKIVGNIVDNSAPIIDKELQRRHDKKMSLIQVPDVVDMSVLDAQEHLKSRGFTVHILTAKPNIKFAKAFPGEVVAMSPKSGKFQTGHLVKLYFADEQVIKESFALLEAKQAKNKEFNQTINQMLDKSTQLLKKKKD